MTGGTASRASIVGNRRPSPVVWERSSALPFGVALRGFQVASKAQKIAGAFAGIISTLAAGAELVEKFATHHAGDNVAAASTQVAMAPTPTLPPVVHDGPIRISALPFKNLGAVTDNDLGAMADGLEESIVTDFGENADFKLIERGQIDASSVKEIDFGDSKYVDKNTRAELGKIVGAEVVVIGGYQRAGKTVRATARFVNTETGEVLEAVKVEKDAKDIFGIQDELARQVKLALPKVKGRLRV
jgi:TolB-like protein